MTTGLGNYVSMPTVFYTNLLLTCQETHDVSMIGSPEEFCLPKPGVINMVRLVGLENLYGHLLSISLEKKQKRVVNISTAFLWVTRVY